MKMSVPQAAPPMAADKVDAPKLRVKKEETMATHGMAATIIPIAVNLAWSDSDSWRVVKSAPAHHHKKYLIACSGVAGSGLRVEVLLVFIVFSGSQSVVPREHRLPMQSGLTSL